jgi:hypothetical protein
MSTIPMWELTSGFTSLFPSGNDDCFQNEKGYYVWNPQMKIVFCTCKLWGIVSGSESKPPDSDTVGKSNWEKKDSSTLTLMYKCCKTDVLFKISDAEVKKLGIY